MIDKLCSANEDRERAKFRSFYFVSHSPTGICQKSDVIPHEVLFAYQHVYPRHVMRKEGK